MSVNMYFNWVPDLFMLIFGGLLSFSKPLIIVTIKHCIEGYCQSCFVEFDSIFFLCWMLAP